MSPTLSLTEIFKKQFEDTETQFRLLVNSVRDYAIFMIDPKGYVMSWNQGAQNIKGYTAEEAIGQHISMFYTEEDKNRKEPEHNLKLALEKGSFEIEGWRMRKDGTRFWASVVFTALYDDKGRHKGFAKVTRDINERKSAEHKIHQMNEMLEKLVNEKTQQLADYKYALEESSIVAITDQKGIITYANDNFCRISKYSREELIGQDHRIISSHYHPKEFIRDLWVTIANGNIWKGELRNRAKNGNIYWVDTTIVPFLDEHKKPYQYIAIRSDITERKVAEENLLKTLKEVTDYKGALDESAIVTILDDKGVYIHANDNFCKMSQYSREELIGRHYSIFDANPGDAAKNAWDRIADGKIFKGELISKAKDGTIYFLDTTVIPFLDEKGKPYQYAAIRFDITERKKAELGLATLNEQLEQKVEERTTQLAAANKELEAFSYSVSHDLRAPLRAVNGFASMLKEDYAPILDDEGKRLLGEVQGNAKKMGHLIDELLEFSKLGRKQVRKAIVEMPLLVNAVLNEINQTVTHNARVIIHPLHTVFADQHLLWHVITNLLSNAIKYSAKRKEPVVEISSKEEDGQIVYTVKDNGAGFDMRYIDKLFGVFQRLHSVDEFEGTGVGLAIVQRIIYKHGGKIWAEGEVGKGAAFHFSLPIVEPVKHDEL